MRDLPTGTVTFLFTDVEGSTRLLLDLGECNEWKGERYLHEMPGLVLLDRMPGWNGLIDLLDPLAERVGRMDEHRQQSPHFLRRSTEQVSRRS